MIYLYILGIILILLVLYSLSSSKERDALDVYYSLLNDEQEDAENKEDSEKVTKISLNIEQKIILIFSVIIISVLSLLFLTLNTSNIIFALVLALSLSYIIARMLAKREAKNIYKKYDFYLPIVMERLVMAVQGGNDVYSSVNVIVNMSKKNGPLDPVTKLLDMVLKKNKSGISFEDSLSLVANTINLTSIRHAFLHLAIAQKEGGEIITPMKELSDSTQEYYQQIVEKEIAVLPVKATLPLLFAFIGLIIFFLSVPLTQIMSMNGMPK